MLCPKATGKNIAEQHCSLVFLAEPQAISRVQELVAFSGKKGKSDSKHIVFFFCTAIANFGFSGTFGFSWLFLKQN